MNVNTTGPIIIQVPVEEYLEAKNDLRPKEYLAQKLQGTGLTDGDLIRLVSRISRVGYFHDSLRWHRYQLEFV